MTFARAKCLRPNAENACAETAPPGGARAGDFVPHPLGQNSEARTRPIVPRAIHIKNFEGNSPSPVGVDHDAIGAVNAATCDDQPSHFLRFLSTYDQCPFVSFGLSLIVARGLDGCGAVRNLWVIDVPKVGIVLLTGAALVISIFVAHCYPRLFKTS